APPLERRRLALGELRAAPLADELLNGGHGVPRVSTPARAGPCFPGPVQPACGGLVVTDRRTPRSNRDERPWQCYGRGDAPATCGTARAIARAVPSEGLS